MSRWAFVLALIICYSQQSRTFLSRMLTTFFDRTDPASRKANPACMNITNAPMMRRKNYKTGYEYLYPIWLESAQNVSTKRLGCRWFWRSFILIRYPLIDPHNERKCVTSGRLCSSWFSGWESPSRWWTGCWTTWKLAASATGSGCFTDWKTSKPQDE